MNWKKRVALFALLVVGSTVLSAAAPAFFLQNLASSAYFTKPPPTVEYWDAVRGTIILWRTESWLLGNRIVEVSQPGIASESVLVSNPLFVREPVPAWARVSDTVGVRLTTEGYGWPWIALTAHKTETIFAPGSAVTQHIATFRLLGHDVTMPTSVYWPGALRNAATFAAVWGAVLLVPPIVRTRLRIARGQCLKCGYDVRSTGGVICPECGTPAQGAGRKVSSASSG